MRRAAGRGRRGGGLVIETLGQLAFGAGAGTRHLLDGWSDPEDGFTWAVGNRARFTLPVEGDRQAGGRLMLELDLNPFAPPGSLRGQRLTVLAGGVPVFEQRVVGEGTLGIIVPDAAWPADGLLVVTLLMPDACRPVDAGFGADGRVLGFMLRSAALRRVESRPALRRTLPPLGLAQHLPAPRLGEAFRLLTGMPSADMLAGCESLGHNCEFGVAQRHFGAEPLGLLRFSGITLPDLLRGVERRFAGAGDPDQLEVLVADGVRREFMVRDRLNRFSLHTLRFEDEAEAGQVRREAQRHLGFLQRMFAETLAGGEKLFVFARAGQTLEAQARPLLARLRAHGPNALLFVTEGDAHPPGTVEELDHGLFRGWTDRMAPQEDVGSSNLPAWLSNCANARRLWSVQRSSA